jgi:hypothetical protein
MKLKTLLITTIGAFAVASANAGDSTPTGKAVVEEPADLGVSVTAGYNSHYIFRGINYGESQVTTQIDYDIPGIPLAVGAWYGNPTRADGGHLDGHEGHRTGNNPGHYDELDLYAKVSHSFGAVEAWLGYTAYLYPESGADGTNEVGTGAGGALGPIDLALGVYYDFDIGGWYMDLTAGHSFTLCDFASLDLSAGISYQIDYNGDGSDWNNVLLIAAIPIKLSESATFSVYAAGTLSMDAIDSHQDDEFFGGASLAVTF